MPSLNWNDIQWLRDTWKGNLILKGILSVGEARKAAELGVDGIVLSNHGGRQLDHAVSPMEILPEDRQAVGEDIIVMLDSGFRRGPDILEDPNLGADAFLWGWSTLYGLRSDEGRV